MKFRTFVVVCVAQAFLAGCGGGAGGVDGASGVDSETSSTFDLSRMAFSLASLGGEKHGINLTGIASSGTPLVGVIVTAVDGKGRVTQSQVTDATGRYSMNINKKETYVLTVPFNDIDGSPALLSSVFIFPDHFSDSSEGKSGHANINPLTSLITSRVLKMIPTSVPSGEQIKKIKRETVTKAEREISSLFKPIYTALAIHNSEAEDPIGSTEYQAISSDPLETLFTLARFNVRTGQVSIGTGDNRFVIPVPATGALPHRIPDASVNSLAALNAGETRTPIKHVIVVIGENRTFDSVFATYQAPAGQTIKNLLSQGIINADGTPGPKFGLAKQNKATLPSDKYSITPTRSVAFATLPQPTRMGEYNSQFQMLDGVPDVRFPVNLLNGPFQQTNYVPYSTLAPIPLGITTAGDPVHRFFQMWQQTAGTNANLDLYTWVAVTAGKGMDNAEGGITPDNPGQGGELMAFLNMHTGDVPEWKILAKDYAMSDNYHQSILGGTGANFFAIATADVPYFNVDGAIAVPPENQIENPNPMAGTSNPNFYTQDGYQGGSYVNCADSAQPGVAPILAVLATARVKSKCEAGKYYLVNNYAFGYDKNGTVQPVGPNNFVLPPQTVPTIAEALTNKGVTWKWYTGARQQEDVTADLILFGLPLLPQYYAFAQGLQYNLIGDPLVASKNIMTTSLKSSLAGLTTFYNDINNNTLPAVSFVVPKNFDSGHPGFSVQQKYEQFTQNLVDLISKVQANEELWKHTAIIITTDEGGGYFDTGPIQMQDFFGDGPRIPFFVVSPYARKNHIDHLYHDHASLVKFIQRNWKLAPLSQRSRDNHPNPVHTKPGNASDVAYIPINKTPTVGDLMTMFEF